MVAGCLKKSTPTRGTLVLHPMDDKAKAIDRAWRITVQGTERPWSMNSKGKIQEVG